MRTKLLKLTPVFVGNIVIRNIYCPGKKRYILESDFLAAFNGRQGLVTNSKSLKDIDVTVHGLNEHTRVIESSRILHILKTNSPVNVCEAKTADQILYSIGLVIPAED